VIDLAQKFNHSIHMKYRWLQPFLLALVLLFAQQMTSLHAMTHAVQSQTTQQEQDLPSAKVCSDCLALAEIQSALPSGHTPLLVSAADFIAHIFALQPASTQLALGFSARAPPAFL
jgi:hypothetical protein